ncbi:MAG: hypothetical protein WA637_23710, partial [Terriglobales bacterium]
QLSCSKTTTCAVSTETFVTKIAYRRRVRIRGAISATCVVMQARASPACVRRTQLWVQFPGQRSGLYGAADASAAQLRSLAKGINYSVHPGLVIAAIVHVINIGVESARFVGRKLARVHQATVT